MVTKSTKISNEMGFHMRPANIFVTAMNKYSSDVELIVNGKRIDGKSIMNIMACGIKNGTDITVECNGADEKEMLNEAIELIDSGFGE